MNFFSLFSAVQYTSLGVLHVTGEMLDYFRSGLFFQQEMSLLLFSLSTLYSRCFRSAAYWECYCTFEDKQLCIWIFSELLMNLCVTS